jgi:hypothetical protein
MVSDGLLDEIRNIVRWFRYEDRVRAVVNVVERLEFDLVDARNTGNRVMLALKEGRKPSKEDMIKITGWPKSL